VHGVVFNFFESTSGWPEPERRPALPLQQRQQRYADHQHHEASRRRGGKRPLYIIHDATPLSAGHVSPMAAPGNAESRLRLCLEWCDRVAKLGPVRGQSAASWTRLARLPSGACKPNRLVSLRPVDQHRASIHSRRPRSAPSGVFCLRAPTSAGSNRICRPCQAVVSSAR
jgi:hypothetical protein